METSVIVVGSPRIIRTGLGKVLHFNGIGDSGDALFFDTLPLAGTLPYTWELVFRPAFGGGQGAAHLPSTGNRLRIASPLRNTSFSTETGAWTVLPRTIPSASLPDPPSCSTAIQSISSRSTVGTPLPLFTDGTTLRSYVNGILQGEGRGKASPTWRGRRIAWDSLQQARLLQRRHVQRALYGPRPSCERASQGAVKALTRHLAGCGCACSNMGATQPPGGTNASASAGPPGMRLIIVNRRICLKDAIYDAPRLFHVILPREYRLVTQPLHPSARARRLPSHPATHACSQSSLAESSAPDGPATKRTHP